MASSLPSKKRAAQTKSANIGFENFIHYEKSITVEMTWGETARKPAKIYHATR